MYIYFLAYVVKFTLMRIVNLGRRSPGGDRVLCKGRIHLQDTSG